jgi:hypothetical protein
MESQIRVCEADQSPSTSQLGAAPGKVDFASGSKGKVESAAVPSGIALQQVNAVASQTSTRTLNLDVPLGLTSVQRGLVVLRVEEVAGYGGTFEDAVNAWMIKEPEMMPFPQWVRWRKAEAFLPIPKRGTDRLMAYLEELKIWDRIMRLYHSEWEWFMDTWAITETENVETYLRAIREDEGVLEPPAPVGSAPEESVYVLYAIRMHKLYAALDMVHNRVDETTFGIQFWDFEVLAQISYLAESKRVAWLKKLFLQIATAPDDLMSAVERSCCADAIVEQIMEQGHEQRREAILAQRTEKGDSSSQTSWPVHPPKNSQSGSCAKAVKVLVKVLAEEKNGSSGSRSAAGRTKRNKKNKERLRVKRDLVGSGPSQDATGRGSTSGAPISTEETELFEFVRQKELCHSVRRKKKEEKKKEVQELHDELRRDFILGIC